jgi:hypothetical protein
MAVIPFAGAKNVTVYKLPYTLPLLASLGLLWQIFEDQSENGVLADSFASLQDGTEEYTTTVYRLTPAALISYPVTGSSPTVPIGNPAIATGANAECPLNTPEFASYNLPPGGNTINVAAFSPVTAPFNPPFFHIYQEIRFWPVVIGGAVGFRLFALDSGFSPWYCMLKPGGGFTDWINANPPDLGFPASALDLAGNRSLNYDTSASTITQIVIDPVSGAETPSVLFSNPDQTGHAMLDIPSFCNTNQLAGYLLSADNTAVGAGPLVLGGSPVFLLEPDLSSYSEIVFLPGNAAVLPNPLGVYGPAWNYGAEFQSRALSVVDVDGNFYYIQLNPGGTAYDVYSSAAPAVSPQIFGTHVGFAVPGRFGGGTK